MPVYNAEENITKSIESIINQSMNLNDIEVIFIDDCSSDNSRKIIRKYCDIYSKKDLQGNDRIIICKNI